MGKRCLTKLKNLNVSNVFVVSHENSKNDLRKKNLAQKKAQEEEEKRKAELAQKKAQEEEEKRKAELAQEKAQREEEEREA